MTQLDALLKYVRRRKLHYGLLANSGSTKNGSLFLELSKCRPLTKLSHLFACFSCELVAAIGKRYASVKYGEIDLCPKCENRVLIANGCDSEVRVLVGGKSIQRDRRRSNSR